MRKAFAVAREGAEKGEFPFGACLQFPDGTVFCAHNTCVREGTMIDHAEMNAIRLANRSRGEMELSEAILYSTTEPCIQCTGAIWWSGIRKVVFSTYVVDSLELGFKESGVGLLELNKHFQLQIDIIEGFLREEGKALFTSFKDYSLWKQRGILHDR